MTPLDAREPSWPSTLELDLAEREVRELESRLRQRASDLLQDAQSVWRGTLKLKHAALSLAGAEPPVPGADEIARRAVRTPFPSLSVPDAVTEAIKLRQAALTARLQAVHAFRAHLKRYESELGSFSQSATAG